MNQRLVLTFTSGVALAAMAAGCSAASDDVPGDGDFVSDNPYGGDGYGNGEDGAAGTATGGDGDGGDDGGGEGAPGDDGDPAREIAEADIVQVVGDRVYALSRYSGLAVIDAKDPRDLKILGRYESEAEPFEMYVDGDQVFVMFTDFGTWQYDALEGYYSWQTDSRLITLDASAPSEIEVTGNYAMPGEIQDSRRVGDVLYLVTYEDGYCWGCGDRQRTVVTSLDVSDESDPALVDQLPFVDEKDTYGWKRSVSATNERLYIAGPRWSSSSEDVDGSRIEVVDISDPGGTLFKGTSVEVSGQIQSRWQMDEHDDVLRVVSQPGWWWSGNAAPKIETFTVVSSSQITPLGSTTMVLPRPESLRSVRFDGDKAYAITFEQTDPLFTIDLSDPAVPKQVGELEIPGWVYHMEPRGDQILALGFDRGAAEGSLNVSLFDVSDFANPTMLDRVHFGGDWADFAEDQDRVHKAFTILDEQGLIMVPYEGWHYDEGDGGAECGYSRYEGGVQLIDFDTAGLDLRGVAESRGRARRAFMHRDHVFTVSDRAVQTFDINNRDNPQRTDEVALAVYVQEAMPVGEHVVRTSRDWWSDEFALEVAPANDPASPDPVGRLDIADALPAGDCYEWYGYGEMLAVGGYVYLISDGHERTAITVVDISDPTAPTVVTTEVFDFQRGWGDSWFGGFESHGERLAVAGDSLVLQTTEWLDGNGHDNVRGTFEIIDVSDPRSPKLAKSVARGKGMAMGALIHTDGALISWHTESANKSGSKVRFYIDRLQVSDPASAKLKSPVNVPGMPVAFREDLGRAITVDFQFTSEKISEEKCWNRPGGWDYDYDNGRCRFLRHDVYSVDVDDGKASIAKSLDVEQGAESSLRAAMASDTRVFFEVSGPSEDAARGWGSEVVSLELSAGKNAKMGRSELLPGWVRLAQAEGARALAFTDGHMTVVDATDPEAPTTEAFDTGTGYGCWDLAMHGDQAYCAKGQYGLSVFELP